MAKQQEDEVVQYLETQAQQGSLASVQRACRQFLRQGAKAAALKTKRRAVPRSWTLAALVMQGGLCALCGEAIDIEKKDRFNLAGDHFQPLALGGPHNKANVVAAHRSCNSRKGAESPLETAKRLGVTVVELLRRQGKE